jgi:hypothetical protein
VAYVLLAVGTVLVIYFYVMTENAERNSKKPAAPEADGPRPEAVPRKPHIRQCPICGAAMGPADRLYAEIYKATPRDKVFIKGCPRCYAAPGKPESRPDFLKDVDL